MKKTLPTVLALTLISLSFLATALPGQSRSLTEREMLSLYGGQNYTDACCEDFAPCVPGPATTCGRFTNFMDCNMGTQEQWFGGNRRKCIVAPAIYPGGHCTDDPSSQHVCYQEHDCTWDAMFATCLVGALNTTNSITNTCTNFAPCPP